MCVPKRNSNVTHKKSLYPAQSAQNAAVQQSRRRFPLYRNVRREPGRLERQTKAGAKRPVYRVAKQRARRDGTKGRSLGTFRKHRNPRTRDTRAPELIRFSGATSAARFQFSGGKPDIAPG